MTYMTPFEKHQTEQQKDIKLSPKLQWSNEIVSRMANEPRQAQESPLKRWWLEQRSRVAGSDEIV